MSIFEKLEDLNVSEECFDSIMDIVEEYINEVTQGYVKKKVEAVLPKREANADHALSFAGKVHRYELNKTGDVKNTPLGDKASSDYYKSSNRWAHALQLSKYLKDSKKPIKPLVQAAKKVADSRSEHHWDEVEPTGTQEEIKKSYDRAAKAGALARTDKRHKSDIASGY